ncbi:MAG TPA: O-antigen ligase family protein [Solirubrobacteraceae bacterium]|jgi:O-antigen ligase|nr:O-antigen ligase family protein [Solirubrobacteraceae bacterium]
MNARTRAFEVVPSTILAMAAVLGVIAALQPTIAVALVAGLVLAYVVFSDLAAGFAVLAFLSFLESLASGSLSPAKAAGLLLAVAWLARFSLGERSERDFFADHSYLTWTLIAFFGWAVISLLWAPSTSASTGALQRYAPNLLLIPIGYTAVRTRRDLAIVVGAIILGAMVAAAFAVLQPPNPAIVEESARATGTIGDPNELAAVLLVGLALGAGFALGRGRAPLMRVVAAVAVPLCLAGVFLSLSRGGLVALAAMMLAGTIFAGRWRMAITLMLVTIAGGGFIYFTQLAPLPARERVSSAKGGTGRTDLWTVASRMVQAHPITGVGVGNFPNTSAEYTLRAGPLQRTDLIFNERPYVTHNTYLQITAEMGVPALLLFLGIIAACMSWALRAARIWARRGEVVMEVLARSMFLGLCGMLVADFFISVMYSKLLWVLLALGPAMYAIARHDDASEPVAADSHSGRREPSPAQA